MWMENTKSELSGEFGDDFVKTSILDTKYA